MSNVDWKEAVVSLLGGVAITKVVKKMFDIYADLGVKYGVSNIGIIAIEIGAFVGGSELADYGYKYVKNRVDHVIDIASEIAKKRMEMEEGDPEEIEEDEDE